jgi:Tol biopolymer transport system component
MIYVQTNNQANIQGVEFDLKNAGGGGAPFWITRGDREVARAELAPDGKQFLMRQIRRTQDDLVIVNRDGSEWRDVTDDAPFDRYPRWSPDGRQIAFASDRGDNYEIWICSADGTNLRQITFVGASRTGTSFPLWSPDGKQLIYSVNNQSFIIDLDKRWREQTPRKISEPPDGVPAFNPWDWSPDGKKLAGTFGPGLRAIGFYSFETDRFEELAEVPGATPSWLPNSQNLVYAADNKIFLADTKTKKIKQLPQLVQSGELRSPFVSRDGRLLYYIVQTSESDVWLLDNSPTE